MKRFFLYAVAIAIFLFAGILPSWAITPTKTVGRLEAQLTRIPERTSTISARVTERVEKMDARGESLVQRKELALRVAENKLRLLDALWTRVRSRMTKMEENGKDLASLQGKIKDVDTKRQAAADAIAAAKEALVAETTPGTTIQKPRQQRLKVVPALRAYHQAMVSVITSLSTIQKKDITPKPSASAQ